MNSSCPISVKRLLFSLLGLVFVSGMAFVLTLVVDTPAAHASCLDNKTPCAWVQYHQPLSNSLLIAWWYDTDPNIQPIKPDVYVVSWAQDGIQAGQATINATGSIGTYTVSNIDPTHSVITMKVQACNNSLPEQPVCTDWSDVVSYHETPANCSANYRWRNAYAGDHVCVSIWSYAQAATDNNNATSRVIQAPDTCIKGYVWRLAGPQDHVCVTPQVRAQTAYDNQLGPQYLVK
jgi:hypothetical protein